MVRKNLLYLILCKYSWKWYEFVPFPELLVKQQGGQGTLNHGWQPVLEMENSEFKKQDASILPLRSQSTAVVECMISTEVKLDCAETDIKMSQVEEYTTVADGNAER